MKIDDVILQEEDLVEIKLRHAIAAAMLATASPHIADHQPPKSQAVQVVKNETQHLVDAVLSKYKISKAEAEKIVKLAQRHAKPTFPTARDILAVIGVESSFRPAVKSGLKKDPAIGLMQIRPKIWKTSKAELQDMEYNIKLGAEILHHYYDKLKNKEHAFEAYNVGIKNFLTKKLLNPSYPRKVMNELKRYEIK